MSSTGVSAIPAAHYTALRLRESLRTVFLVGSVLVVDYHVLLMKLEVSRMG